jgi:nucleotide-binding universal stress UspA family protein
MYRYSNILVGVSAGESDDTLVRYAELVSFMAQSERVRFVHVAPSPTAFSDLYSDYAHSYSSAVSELDEHIDTLVGEKFVGPQGVSVSSEVVEGAPLAELLRITKEEDMDLLIVGRDQRGGTLAEKLARKAPCSVLIVPPEGPTVIEHVLVPVDFSSHAADAVDVAVAFAEAAGLEEVHLLHVYDVPESYLKLGKTFEEFHESVQQRAVERFDSFLEGIDLRGLRPVRHVVRGEDVPAAIHDQVDALDMDLVVVGTRGRSASVAVLLGSVGEQVVRAARVPVVAVKRKGATLGLLDALFDI